VNNEEMAAGRIEGNNLVPTDGNRLSLCELPFDLSVNTHLCVCACMCESAVRQEGLLEACLPAF